MGNTAFLKKVLYANPIGDVTLLGSWRDEQFDPEQHALTSPGPS